MNLDNIISHDNHYPSFLRSAFSIIAPIIMIQCHPRFYLIRRWSTSLPEYFVLSFRLDT